MNLTLQRKWFSDLAVQGSLFIESIFECYTLEPADPSKLIREGGPNPVVPDWSWKYSAILPHIIVPGRSELMFHVGNYHYDTAGCILVGQERGVDSVLKSKLALASLCEKLCIAWQRQEKVYLSILKEVA